MVPVADSSVRIGSGFNLLFALPSWRTRWLCLPDDAAEPCQEAVQFHQRFVTRHGLALARRQRARVRLLRALERSELPGAEPGLLPHAPRHVFQVVGLLAQGLRFQQCLGRCLLCRGNLVVQALQGPGLLLHVVPEAPLGGGEGGLVEARPLRGVHLECRQHCPVSARDQGRPDLHDPHLCLDVLEQLPRLRGAQRGGTAGLQGLERLEGGLRVAPLLGTRRDLLLELADLGRREFLRRFRLRRSVPAQGHLRDLRGYGRLLVPQFRPLGRLGGLEHFGAVVGPQLRRAAAGIGGLHV
mmetsp:Transcript_54200/g.152653  ORF Transcript_54200/g.152653 Transcript_54200/m.152653 type:complete len:298 (-) Transcript_54200:17-910(-)